MKQELTLKETQESVLGVLDKLTEICDLLNVKYYLMFGSLIGAVRHGGFIPWDDDLDVCMRREDYDVLVDYCKKNEQSLFPFKLHHMDTIKGYPFYISRISNEEYILEFDQFPEYSSGIFVDIYPFDGTGKGDGDEYWKSKEREINILKRCLLFSSMKYWVGKSTTTRIFNLPISLYAKLRGNLYFQKKLDKIERTFSWEDSDNVSIPVWRGYYWKLPIDCFSSVAEVDFEGRKIWAPVGYEKVLYIIYGDYMKLPDEKDRVPQHGYRAYKK